MLYLAWLAKTLIMFESTNTTIHNLFVVWKKNWWCCPVMKFWPVLDEFDEEKRSQDEFCYGAKCHT